MECRRRTTRGILVKRMEQCDYSAQYIAKRMNVSDVTIYNWVNNPEKCTLEKLWWLCDVLKISELERAYIMGVPELERFEQILRE